MKILFAHRWLGSLALTSFAALFSLLLFGELDPVLLVLVFLIGVAWLSYPVITERLWRSTGQR